jgi:hypothetical protein
MYHRPAVACESECVVITRHIGRPVLRTYNTLHS